ncbi:hypothetical protein [Bradyrhizobium sp. Tv2a-2]|uniref:hypothetical protein n=1 Tax=Bradyrhizobium sp. Tv2a-2 TaxID=113395 RepID=UPI0003F9D080|nr:hypothetical protein [Bradyrhizobium sp. Tv2a-2]
MTALWSTPVKAAADFLGNGAIEINKYETEIYDIIRRNSVFLQRVDRRPANGHPHRYFEQTAIASATFTDPRNISPTPTGPTRVERSAMVKAITNQTNLSLFDVDVTRQQGQFAYVEAKDIEDIVNSVVVASASAVWTGTDTSLTSPTTTQYVSALTQISTSPNAAVAIANGASIIDGLKAQVAQMAANTTYVIRPTAIYIDPILGDYLDREAKASQLTFDKIEVVGGVKVNAIQTQIGTLPLIVDPFLGAAKTAQTVAAYGLSAVPSGFNGYYAVIVTEKDIEMAVVHGGDGNLNPRLFQLGLLAGLQGQYVAILFDNLIVKGFGYAHKLVQVIRP